MFILRISVIICQTCELQQNEFYSKLTKNELLNSKDARNESNSYNIRL